MAKAYAESFYNGTTWRRTSRTYMMSQNYICEKCGNPARICHHVKHITPQNITDLNITLNFENLACWCQDCHTKHHLSGDECKEGLMFDSNGDLVHI